MQLRADVPHLKGICDHMYSYGILSASQGDNSLSTYITYIAVKTTVYTTMVLQQTCCKYMCKLASI